MHSVPLLLTNNNIENNPVKVETSHKNVLSLYGEWLSGRMFKNRRDDFKIRPLESILVTWQLATTSSRI